MWSNKPEYFIPYFLKKSSVVCTMNNLVDIKDYTKRLTDELKAEFGDRLLYIGLQGSYLRGEATPDSDIDIMLVLDEIHAADLSIYRRILEELGEYDRACGFVCGNEKENKDVYMVALRNESGELIAYYEKHEYRNRETMKMYDMD